MTTPKLLKAVNNRYGKSIAENVQILYKIHASVGVPSA